MSDFLRVNCPAACVWQSQGLHPEIHGKSSPVIETLHIDDVDRVVNDTTERSSCPFESFLAKEWCKVNANSVFEVG